MKLYNIVKGKIRWVHIAVVYIVQIVVFQLMVRYTFPIINGDSNEVKLFDMMKSGYDSVLVSHVVKSYSISALNTYKYIQMPIDFLYPVLMVTVMIFVFIKTTKKYNILYFLLPGVFVLFDWVENICILHFLNAYSINSQVVVISSFCTRNKALLGDYILKYLVIAFIVIYIIRKIFNKIQNRK